VNHSGVFLCFCLDTKATKSQGCRKNFVTASCFLAAHAKPSAFLWSLDARTSGMLAVPACKKLQQFRAVFPEAGSFKTCIGKSLCLAACPALNIGQHFYTKFYKG
jgi:hypothetical protein